MPWQQRPGGSYYYRSIRLAGGVSTAYLGRGAVAELAAGYDLLRKIERIEEKEREQAALARRQAANDALEKLCKATALLARATLLAAGYHQHDRSEWRKRRAARDGGQDMHQDKDRQAGRNLAPDGLGRLVERAGKGDTTVLPDLRRLLDERPEIWRQVGDLARAAEEALIGLAAGEHLLVRESIRRKLGELKAGLAPASPLERVLVDRIGVCWLAANHADASSAQASGPRADQVRRRQDSASRRFLEAAKALATVRRLLGPRAARGRAVGGPGGSDCGDSGGATT